jgi:hypothetical protein
MQMMGKNLKIHDIIEEIEDLKIIMKGICEKCRR